MLITVTSYYTLYVMVTILYLTRAYVPQKKNLIVGSLGYQNIPTDDYFADVLDNDVETCTVEVFAKDPWIIIYLDLTASTAYEVDALEIFVAREELLYIESVAYLSMNPIYTFENLTETNESFYHISNIENNYKCLPLEVTKSQTKTKFTEDILRSDCRGRAKAILIQFNTASGILPFSICEIRWTYSYGSIENVLKTNHRTYVNQIGGTTSDAKKAVDLKLGEECLIGANNERYVWLIHYGYKNNKEILYDLEDIIIYQSEHKYESLYNKQDIDMTIYTSFKYVHWSDKDPICGNSDLYKLSHSEIMHFKRLTHFKHCLGNSLIIVSAGTTHVRICEIELYTTYRSDEGEFKPVHYSIHGSYTPEHLNILKDGILLDNSLSKNIMSSGCFSFEKRETSTIFSIILPALILNQAWEIYIIASQLKKHPDTLGDIIYTELGWGQEKLIKQKCHPIKVRHPGQMNYHDCPTYIAQDIIINYVSSINSKYLHLCEILVGAEKKVFSVGIHSNKNDNSPIEEGIEADNDPLELYCKLIYNIESQSSHEVPHRRHVSYYPDPEVLKPELLSYKWFVGNQEILAVKGPTLSSYHLNGPDVVRLPELLSHNVNDTINLKPGISVNPIKPLIVEWKKVGYTIESYSKHEILHYGPIKNNFSGTYVITAFRPFQSGHKMDINLLPKSKNLGKKICPITKMDIKTVEIQIKDHGLLIEILPPNKGFIPLQSGVSQSLRCQVNKDHMEFLGWYYGLNTFVISLEDIFVIDGESSLAGDYQCRYKNLDDGTEVKANVLILVYSLNLESYNGRYLQANTSLNLSCRIYLAPPVPFTYLSVDWSLNNKLLTTQSHPSFYMEAVDVLNHTGIYDCLVIGKINLFRHHYELSVQSKYKITVVDFRINKTKSVSELDLRKTLQFFLSGLGIGFFGSIITWLIFTKIIFQQPKMPLENNLKEVNVIELHGIKHETPNYDYPIVHDGIAESSLIKGKDTNLGFTTPTWMNFGNKNKGK